MGFIYSTGILWKALNIKKGLSLDYRGLILASHGNNDLSSAH